jgi:hypothetical protein
MTQAGLMLVDIAPRLLFASVCNYTRASFAQLGARARRDPGWRGPLCGFVFR